MKVVPEGEVGERFARYEACIHECNDRYGKDPEKHQACIEACVKDYLNFRLEIQVIE